ncbi:MAG: hypothetical protein FWG02_11140 [Holophagaceae bacterium]|nr:hypothetical protein [Holophagaceae bacterium]
MLNVLILTAMLSLHHPQDRQQPQDRPPAATEDVEIKSEAIILPHMPTSIRQALREQRTTYGELVAKRSAIEQELAQLSKDYQMEEILQPIVLSKSQLELSETSLLLSILTDTKIDSLLDETIKMWNRWQMTLVHHGYLHFYSSGDDNDIEHVMPLELDERTAKTLRLRKSSMYRSETFEGDIAIISDAIAPDFSKVWESFRLHINESLKKFAEAAISEITLQDKDIKRLFDAVTIVVYGKIRSALWVAENVWERLTNNKPRLLRGEMKVHSIQAHVINGQSSGGVTIRLSSTRTDHRVVF